VTALGVIIALGLVLPFEYLTFFLQWLIGVGVVLLMRCKMPSPPTLWATLALVAVLVALRYLAIKADYGFAAPWFSSVKGLILGVVFGVFLWSFKADAGKPASRWDALHAKLADFSYSLYLTHFPLLVFLVSCLYQVKGYGFRSQPSLFNLMYFFSVLMATYVLAYVVYLIAERRTRQIKQMLVSALLKLGVRP
jgi:peptidoglycan/LPS O-acetylase OafA/YrhL